MNEFRIIMKLLLFSILEYLFRLFDVYIIHISFWQWFPSFFFSFSKNVSLFAVCRCCNEKLLQNSTYISKTILILWTISLPLTLSYAVNGVCLYNVALKHFNRTSHACCCTTLAMVMKTHTQKHTHTHTHFYIHIEAWAYTRTQATTSKWW